MKTDLNCRAESYEKGSFVVYTGFEEKRGWEAVLRSLPFQPGTDFRQTGLMADPIEMPTIALVETYFHDMDAGWTRYVFDTYHIPFTVLHPG